MVHEILSSGHRLASLVMEADHVAQGMIAENDAQFAAGFDDLVGPIHLTWVAHMAAMISAASGLLACAS